MSEIQVHPATLMTAAQVRQAMWDYCEFASAIAEENQDNPYAVGLARAYRDMQDKLRPAMDADDEARRNASA